MIDVKVRTEFDEKTVLVPADLMGRRMLGKVGGFTMKTAQRSVRTAPKLDASTGERLGRGRRRKDVPVIDASAPADEPPYKHAGSRWTNLIQYAVYEDGSGVVMGIVKTDGGRTGNMPALTEVGGDALLRRAHGKNSRRVHYEPHPVMAPALDKNLANAAKLLENKLK